APREVVELFGVAKHYVGLGPIESNRWNLAMSIPAARVRDAKGNHDALFSAIRSENSVLADRMKRATRISNWLAAPLPRFSVRSRWPQNVIPIGNAAAAIEPIGGEGMGLALRSAELAAGRLLAGGCCTEQLGGEFRRLWG